MKVCGTELGTGSGLSSGVKTARKRCGNRRAGRLPSPGLDGCGGDACVAARVWGGGCGSGASP